MQEMRLAEPQAEQYAQINAAFAEHLAELPPIYFLRGEQNLDGLRFWTQGLADGLSITHRIARLAASGRTGRSL